MTAGEALRGVLGVIGMKQVDLARRADVSPKHVNQVLQGNARLTPEVAVVLSDAIAEWLLALDTANALREIRGRASDA